jgi:bifunctional UDP-N-acetylglucosamine pyrophosphorylase/glucosamine-1-phosphate N-acetyltransferase
MRRVLIIPAAGRGSRLQADVPKVLVQVAGRAMLDHLLIKYRDYVSAVVVVVSPGAEAGVRAHCRTLGENVVTAVQHRPTGMLDAILAAAPAAAALNADRTWITWCDQVAIRPATVARLAAVEQDHADAAIVLPTADRADPYIHFLRDPSGRITGVLQRREGDAMPPVGESDAGLFSLSPTALDVLGVFSESVPTGGGTAERNFLPFIPWIAQTTPVHTFPCSDPFEAIGINTPDDLREVERFLARQVGA